MPIADTATNGVAFLVSGGAMAEFIAKACSSPQTGEINADVRAPTLMKWVYVGMMEGAVFVAIAAYLDPRHRAAIIAGGVLEAAITYGEYRHAIQAGLANPGPGTEGQDNEVHFDTQA